MQSMFEALGMYPEVRTYEAGEVRVASHSFKMRRFPRVRVFTAMSGDPERAIPICVMHGYHRNADDYRDAWAPLIAGHDAIVIAPRFSRARFPTSESYSWGNVADEIGRRYPRRHWSFQLIEPLVRGTLAAVGAFPGPFRMFGHSAGAQFVHRYLAYVPGAPVSRAVAANAGWYTMPRRLRDFPYGLRGGPRVDLSRWLARDLRILVGSEDVTAELRRDDPETLRQGATRLERAHTFHALGQEAAAKRGTAFGWTLNITDGVGHDYLGMSSAAAPILLGD